MDDVDEMVSDVPGLRRLTEDMLAAAAEYDPRVAGLVMHVDGEVHAETRLKTLAKFVAEGPSQLFFAVNRGAAARAGVMARSETEPGGGRGCALPATWDVSPEEWMMGKV